MAVLLVLINTNKYQLKCQLLSLLSLPSPVVLIILLSVVTTTWSLPQPQSDLRTTPVEYSIKLTSLALSPLSPLQTHSFLSVSISSSDCSKRDGLGSKQLDFCLSSPVSARSVDKYSLSRFLAGVDDYINGR